MCERSCCTAQQLEEGILCTKCHGCGPFDPDPVAVRAAKAGVTIAPCWRVGSWDHPGWGLFKSEPDVGPHLPQSSEPQIHAQEHPASSQCVHVRKGEQKEEGCHQQMRSSSWWAPADLCRLRCWHRLGHSKSSPTAATKEGVSSGRAQWATIWRVVEQQARTGQMIDHSPEMNIARYSGRRSCRRIQKRREAASFQLRRRWARRVRGRAANLPYLHLTLSASSFRLCGLVRLCIERGSALERKPLENLPPSCV